MSTNSTAIAERFTTATAMVGPAPTNPDSWRHALGSTEFPAEPDR